MWHTVLTSLSAVCFLVACSGDVDDSSGDAPGAVSTIGKRCGSAGDCDVGQTCKSDFAFERSVCTSACTTDADCPSDAVCASGIRDYNSQTLEPLCMRPCTTDASCGNSVCDDRPAGVRYCF